METNYKKGNNCGMSGDKGCPKPLEIKHAYLSKKWTMSIIVTLGNKGKLRFNQLKKKLEQPTSKILSERLQQLNEKDIVDRKNYGEVPPKVEYSLTEKGKDLVKALGPLIEWAETYRSS